VVKTAPDPSSTRMIATVAWLYHTRGLRQSAIAERMLISQSRVSRLLEQAADLGIVKTVVVLPKDEQSVLEQELEFAYGMKEVHVYDLGVVGNETELQCCVVTPDLTKCWLDSRLDCGPHRWTRRR